jgi:hypothetical protein
MCPHSATDRFEIENVGVKQRPDGRCIADGGDDEEDEEDEFLADIKDTKENLFVVTLCFENHNVSRKSSS